MTEILIIAEVVIGVLLIITILLQNKQASLNLASMGWWMEQITKRGADKVLHNVTVILWTLFILISILLFVAS
jgi:protein translocase SecG subunit